MAFSLINKLPLPIRWPIINLAYQQMPFARVQYNYLRNQGLTYTALRNRFLCITITYTLVFLALGGVFCGLWIMKTNELDQYNCSVCASYGTPFSCGYQLCCDQNGFFSNSIGYCVGNFTQVIFFILMIVCFCYGGYELFLVVCHLCYSPLFRADAVVVTGPQVGLTTTYNSPYGYGNDVIIT